jgi:hypothetical protein
VTDLRPRSYWIRAAHLAALAAFGIAQPLFDLLAKTPEFFVARGSTRADLFTFAFALVLVPPAALILAELVLRLASRRAADAAHLLFVGLLTGIFALVALRRVDSLSTPAIFAGAVLLGLLAAAVYARARAARTIVSVLAAAPALFLVVFLMRAPLADLAATDVAKALPAPPVQSQTPVVLVVIDEMTTTALMDAQGRIDRARYPSFAALARDSTWFRRAMTPHEHTTGAVPAILDGRLPKNPGDLPVLRDHPNNVFTLLGGSYRVEGWEPVTQLCPAKICPRHRDPFTKRMTSLASDMKIVYGHVVLPKTLERRLPSVSETWKDFGGGHGGKPADHDDPLSVTKPQDVDRMVGRQLWRDQRAVWAGFLSTLRRGDSPQSFYFVHVLLPHAPYRYLPSGHQYPNALGIDGLEEDRWTTDPWLVTQGWQRHLLQVGFTDRLLGDLLHRMHAARLYDRSLLIVVGDEGVSFIPGDHRRSVTPRNFDDIGPVPLFVKKPFQHAARISDAHVSSIDVVPTIADVLGMKVPWTVDGHSLVRAPLPDNRRITIYERGGGSLSAPAAAVDRGMARALAQKIAIFGTGARSLYAIGPHRALVGRAVDRLPVAEGRLSVHVDGTTLLNAVDPRSALVPTHVTGTIGGGVPGLDLAVAIRGRIEAVTRTFSYGGSARFSAFVPESSLRPGANDVRVYAVRAHGRRVQLERLSGTAGADAYELSQDGSAITLPSGATARVVPTALTGRVEDWFVESGSVRFGGFAADAADHRYVDRVLVFADGKFLYAGPTDVERHDLKVSQGPRPLHRAGFVFELPQDDVGDGSTAKLRFFALRGRVASELRYAQGFPWLSGS